MLIKRLHISRFFENGWPLDEARFFKKWKCVGEKVYVLRHDKWSWASLEEMNDAWGRYNLLKNVISCGGFFLALFISGSIAAFFESLNVRQSGIVSLLMMSIFSLPLLAWAVLFFHWGRERRANNNGKSYGKLKSALETYRQKRENEERLNAMRKYEQEKHEREVLTASRLRFYLIVFFIAWWAMAYYALHHWM